MLATLCLVLSFIAVNAQLQDCVIEGVTYHSGEKFQSPDGCNTCFCSNGAAACTLKFCLPVSHTTCTYGNNTYHNGDSFKSLDGCNSCGCQNGGVVCTEMACIDSSVIPPP